jgi:hypothetical protein
VLPRGLIPIVIADMHAQIDNLLTVLTQNAFLEALEDGTAALVILGDAVHCEVDGQLRAMESSMMLMDLIFRLKLRFPEQVFYVRGNHDSFSEDLAKDGVPQGLLWARELSELRGAVYQRAMGDFYRCCPTWSCPRIFSPAMRRRQRARSAKDAGAALPATRTDPRTDQQPPAKGQSTARLQPARCQALQKKPEPRPGDSLHRRPHANGP